MAHIRKRKLKDGSTAFRVIWEDAAGQAQSKQFSKANGPRPSEAANDFLLELQRSLRQGTYVDPRAGDVTFREFAEQWRLTRVHRDSTADNVERMLRRHVYPTLGAMRLGAVRRPDIQTLVRELSAKPVDARRTESRVLAVGYVRQVMKIVNAVFTEAAVGGLVAASPCRNVALPRDAQAEVVVPTDAQIEIVLDAAPEHWRDVVELVLGTGLRSGELRGLDVERLPVLAKQVRVDRQLTAVVQDHPHCALHPVFGPPKSAAGKRRVPMSPSLATLLGRHIARYGVEQHGLVFFTQRGNPVSRNSLQGSLRAALKAAEFPPGTGLHVFRHRYASGLIAAGLDVLIVSKLLGHSSTRETLDTYGHLWHDHEDRARIAVEAAFPAWTQEPPEGLLEAPRPSEGRAVQSARWHKKSGRVLQLRGASSG